MMPMRMRRKTRGMEKVEIVYRTASAGNVLLPDIPTQPYTSDHACAIQGDFVGRISAA
jgi:hypothetical protein